MFKALSQDELNIVMMAMQERHYNPQDIVIKQGDAGDGLFVVEEGQLDCSKMFGTEEKYLKTYQPGEAFGELALLYNAPRAATIVAKTKVQLWELDRSTFNHIVKDSAVKKREKFESFLETVPILEGMD